MLALSQISDRTPNLQQLSFPMALSTQRASASFPSNESAPRWTYDVFLNFRGVDTRKGFVSHLHHELSNRQGIKTFIDDRELEGGTSIPQELLSAIKESHIAIVVLSPNYASSKWCLDELSTILRCMESRNSILPVFYQTDPSDVGNQRGCFAEAFAKHEQNSSSTEDKEKVVRWKADLKKVSKIFGWHSKVSKNEREIIQQLVESVWRKVHATFRLLDSPQELVGVNFGLEQLSSMLAHDVNDVRFIGITGMGGIGKTTLAKLVYDRIFHHFDVPCFLENVREASRADPTLIRLQETLLSPMLKEKILTQQWGINYTKRCLRNKKVLLVFDDVDRINQLQVLAGKEDWFGMGSRIIVTTRNERLLVEHGITLCHNVEVLNDDEALALFSLHAFKKNVPEDGFLELSRCFIKYARGLPLALETLGSALFERGLDAWNSTRDNLSKIPNPEIFDKLKISYDGLEEMAKSIFLDVACLHKGKCTEEVIEILDISFGISSTIIIDVLIERSLLYQNHLKCIRMHDLIQEMAHKIVHQESKEPGQRRRLLLFDDIDQIFKKNTGTEAIEVISLRLPKVEEVCQWNCEAFSKMDRLRFLEFDNLIFSSGPKSLPCSLRIINWSWYPSKFLPTSFRPHLLAELVMRNSNLVRLWEGKVDLPNLKHINLTNSNKLKSTPDFSGLSNLKILNLRNCKNLVEIHPSIAILKRLKKLDLSRCESIKSLPSEVEMDSLEDFYLRGCSNVKKIPEFGEQMKNVSMINLDGTAIEKIPSTIEHAVGLEELYLRNCKSLLYLPKAICNLKSLRFLDVSGSSKIDKLPGDMDHLVRLKCGGTMTEPLVGMKNINYLEFEASDGKAREGWGLLRLLGLEKSRPDPPPCWGLVLSSLNRLRSLTMLSLENCNLREGDIPDDIGCLSLLHTLSLGGNNFVSLPESIRRLSNLSNLGLEGCKSLQKLPPLPSNRGLVVYLDSCTSLRRLSAPSNSYDVRVNCRNCIALVQDEGWINRILKFVIKGLKVVIPGSEIPEWFSNQSVKYYINVELPPPSCTNWLGIAFCVVFRDAFDIIYGGLSYYYRFRVRSSMELVSPENLGPSGWCTTVPESPLSENLWVFYLPRKYCFPSEDYHQEQFVFEIGYGNICETKRQALLVKKCGVRLVYEQDLKELNQKQLKRTREYCDKAAPSGPGSASFNDTEQIRKKRCN